MLEHFILLNGEHSDAGPRAIVYQADCPIPFCNVVFTDLDLMTMFPDRFREATEDEVTAFETGRGTLGRDVSDHMVFAGELSPWLRGQKIYSVGFRFTMVDEDEAHPDFPGSETNDVTTRKTQMPPGYVYETLDQVKQRLFRTPRLTERLQRLP